MILLLGPKIITCTFFECITKSNEMIVGDSYRDHALAFYNNKIRNEVFKELKKKIKEGYSVFDIDDFLTSKSLPSAYQEDGSMIFESPFASENK